MARKFFHTELRFVDHTLAFPTAIALPAHKRLTRKLAAVSAAALHRVPGACW